VLVFYRIQFRNVNAKVSGSATDLSRNFLKYKHWQTVVLTAYTFVRRDSSARITIRYGLESPGIEILLGVKATGAWP